MANAQSTARKPAGAPPRRIALIIGVKDYDARSGLSALGTPVNDASAINAALRKLGVDCDYLANPTTSQLQAAVTAFKQKIAKADIAVLFYAGHGFQATLDGAAALKFFLPTDFRGPAVGSTATRDSAFMEAIARREILSIEEIHDAVRAHGKVGISFWDACRNNPYYTSQIAIPRDAVRAVAAVRPSTARAARGLTGEPLPSPAGPKLNATSGPRGVIVQSATQPGQLADDGTGAHSPYTEALLKHIGKPGVPIEAVLKAVATDVDRLTSGQQKPQVENDLIGGDVYLVSAPAAATATKSAPGTATDSTTTKSRREGRPAPTGAAPGSVRVPKSCDGQPCRSDATLPGGSRVIIQTTPINPF